MLFLKILAIIIAVTALLGAIFACINAVGIKSNSKFIQTIDTVNYDAQLKPELDSDGFYTFTTDREFKIVQLTDIHIGGGFMSTKKDSMAINAVAAMLSEEKPDLVVVTGDIAYPVPFQAGTFNNKSGAKLFADLMEKLGIYWCLTFGNHDTELYSYYSREKICDFYSSEKYPHCLIQAGPDDVDGFANQVINIKNSDGNITQSLFMLDSHSYVDGDFLGFSGNTTAYMKTRLSGMKTL